MTGGLVGGGIADAGRAIAAGTLSPVALTEHLLDRIRATEPALHAYVTVAADQARSTARRMAAELAEGRRRGPLHGIPLGIKDLIDTAGLRTTYGSPRFATHVPDRDATVVARLRAAGAVLLGKHATHELAWGGRTDSGYFGATHNPYRRGHIPGGSSGGSAASVAAGSSCGAVGTDTAGSVRIPAALSGCVGFKPTRGLVSLAGILPLAPTLDHVGALARTVDDAAAIITAIAGADPADPRTLADPVPDLRPASRTGPGSGGAGSGGGGLPGVERLRVGWLGGWFAALLSPGVAAILADIRRRLSGTGIRIDDVDLADLDPGAVELGPAGATAASEALLTRIVAEAGALHRPAFRRAPELFGADLAELLTAEAPTPARLAATEATVARVGAALLTALTEHDVLVCATVPVPAPPIGAATVPAGGGSVPIELVLTRHTAPFNAIGVPALSVPVGLVDGLPVGLQIAGRRLADGTVLDLGRLVERVRPELPGPPVADG
nr:amidase [Micromonospora sp. DSM 115978]